MAEKTITFTDEFLTWLEGAGYGEELALFDADGDLSNGLTYDPTRLDPNDPNSTVGDTVDALLEMLNDAFESEYDEYLRNSEEDHWH